MPADFNYDVFLSHSAKDKAVVRELAARLQRDDVRVWLDEEQIKPGDSIPAKIEEGLEHSRVLVLCMSANAFGSDWAQLEVGTFRFRDPLNKERRFIPLRLDDAPIKGSLAQFLYINWRPANREQEYAKLLELTSDGQTLIADSSNEIRIGEIQQAFADYIYGPPQGQYPVADLGARQRILIVDDELAMRDMLDHIIRCWFPKLEVILAADGFSALKVFKPGLYAVVITDIVMPRGLNGLKLSERLLSDDPGVILVAMSGYTPNVVEIAHFYEAGGFRFHSKAFDTEIIRETLDMALNLRIPRLFRGLGAICQNQGVLLQKVQSISDSVHFIMKYAKKEGHIAHSLLRHKLKHTVADFLRSVGVGTDMGEKAESVRVQSECLSRLAWVTAKASESAFPSFLRQYVSDLQTEHHGVKVRLRMESSVDELIRGCSAETILALVTCELLDNAINAVSGQGQISVDVAHLRSTEQLSIVVRDGGPGVAAANLPRLFQQGFSTKGEGRGLGLHLVQEAVRQLGGKVTYKTLKGACFSVVIPIESPQPVRATS